MTTESEKMEFFEDISYSEYTREHYEVSTFGTVINKKTKRMLTPFIRSGYPTVLIPIGDGNVKHFPLHRLVAETFLPNPLNLPQVNHKDQNKLNPRVDNLEWCTCQYNINYGDAIYRRVVSMIGHTPEVVCLETGKIYQNQSQAAQELRLDQGNMSRALSGRCKSVGDIILDGFLNFRRNYSACQKGCSSSDKENAVLLVYKSDMKIKI